MSKKISQSDLLSLEQYAKQRSQWREKIRELKKLRRIAIGEHVTLHFENYQTMQYQIQEMLHAEKIFSEAGIQEEIDVYNPLIPDGDNWKVTMMIEYADADIRREQLKQLVGIENHVYVKIADLDPIYAKADEDLERTTSEKTSAVHFLTIPLTLPAIKLLKQNEEFYFAIDHPHYTHQSFKLTDEVKNSLLADLV